MTSQRRKTPAVSNSATPAGAKSTINMPLRHALLPTQLELALLAVYPLTLLLGSLFSHLNPSLYPPTNESTYSAVHQSYQPPHLAPSYFATKRNVFNVYFVKQGWAWITVAVLGFSFLAARGRHAIALPFDRYSFPAQRLGDLGGESKQRDERDSRIRRLWQVVLRYFLATCAWVFVTQWFFGPSITDRVYGWTGGACRRALSKEAQYSIEGDKAAEVIAGVASSAACRVAGGIMMGGYDVSGHVFLLVLGSGMVWLEVLPVILAAVRGLTGQRRVKIEDGTTLALEDAPEGDVYRRGSYTELSGGGDASSNGTGYNTRSQVRANKEEHAKKEQQRGPWTVVKDWTTTLALLVAGLSWWMLLMTSAFFHTWSEKALALVLAGSCLWGIYFAPRASPTVRSIVGMPGL